MKQLVAENAAMGMKIIVRFIDGDKYLKVTPPHLIPLIKKGIKAQAGDLVEIKVSNGWIKIIKLDKSNKKLEKVKGKLKEMGEVESEEDILNKEAEFMNRAGYITRIEEI